MLILFGLPSGTVVLQINGGDNLPGIDQTSTASSGLLGFKYFLVVAEAGRALAINSHCQRCAARVDFHNRFEVLI